MQAIDIKCESKFCPLRDKCVRTEKTKIMAQTESFLSPPYNHVEGYCSEYIRKSKAKPL